jgi:hypothetical protein
MKVNPVHSKISGTRVFHNNNKCTERNNIERKNIKPGTGGLKLCNHCKRLNSISK